MIKRVTGNDLIAAFAAEAKRHVDSEISKVSILTVQGLYMLFAASCCNGTNRSGEVYRNLALGVLRRLKPARLFQRLSSAVPEQAEKQRALSRMWWGLYVFEAYV